MESDDDFELLPSSSPVHQPKLKRLKKAIRVPQYSPTKSPHDDDDDAPPINSPQSDTLPSGSPSPSPIGGHVDESNWGSSPQHDASESDTVKENGSGAMRALDFDSVGQELDGNVEVRSTETEKGEQVADLSTDELDRKRRSLHDDSENKEKKKKKKRIDSDDGDKKLKESATSKIKAEKVHHCSPL